MDRICKVPRYAGELLQNYFQKLLRVAYKSKGGF